MDIEDIVGAVRRRWRLVAGAVLTGLALVLLLWFVIGGSSGTTQYRGSSQYLIPVQIERDVNDDNKQLEALAAEAPPVLLRSIESVALSAETRANAIERSGLDMTLVEADFDAEVTYTSGLITLGVTVDNRDDAVPLAEAYAAAYVAARRQLVTSELRTNLNSLASNITRLRDRFAEVEASLLARSIELPPLDANNESFEGGLLDPDVQLEVDERLALFKQIRTSERSRATLSTQALSPRPYAQIARPTALSRVSTTAVPFPLVAMGTLLAAVLVGMGAAVGADRLDRTIRNSAAASAALSTQTLAEVPLTRTGRYVAFDGPGSPGADAYRLLAATSVATGRLPQVVMVTSPLGTSYDQVAANFAASLTSLGMRVALIATAERQEWFLGPDATSGYEPVRLDALLTAAHHGTLEASITSRLNTVSDGSGLYVVGPARGNVNLALDGLPRLLDALSVDGIEVVVVAGPTYLDDPDATIYAALIRSMLWVVVDAQTTDSSARDAAQRLELTGVESFGATLAKQSRNV